MSRPSKRTRPAVGSIRRSTSRAVVDLPQPELAHQRQRLAAIERERNAVHGAHDTESAGEDQPATDRIVLGEIDGFQQRRHEISASTGARMHAAR